MSYDGNSETRGYLLGISTGWGQAADFLLDIAATEFRAGNDDTATLIRDSARRLRDMESIRRIEYDKYKKEHAKGE